MNTLEIPFQIAFSEGPDKPKTTLTSGRHFRLYPFGVKEDVGKQLSARMIDFVRIGMAVHVVDGLIPRRGLTDGYRWPCLQVPVLDIEFWSNSSITNTLKATLDFLSGGDDWQISFVHDRSVRHEQQLQLNFADKTIVTPYSGGLDSAAGLAARLREDGEHCFIPVTVRHQFLRHKLVCHQLDLLRSRYHRYQSEPWRLLPLTVAAFVRNKRLSREMGLHARNSGHRCRAFLIMVLAGVVAAAEGAQQVEIYESGVGAVNLPLMRGMDGWRTTRNTHPHFLQLMSELFTSAVGTQISFTLPFRNRTKKELVDILADDDLGQLAEETVSCIGHPLRRGNTKQCGVCTACVFRRQTLLLAGIRESSSRYHYNLFGSATDFRKIPDRCLYSLKAFLSQVVALERLGMNGFVPSFFHQHLLDTRVVDSVKDIAPLVELFGRYRDEWTDLATLGKSHGWPWAKWFAPTNKYWTRKDEPCTSLN